MTDNATRLTCPTAPQHQKSHKQTAVLCVQYSNDLPHIEPSTPASAMRDDGKSHPQPAGEVVRN